MAQRSSGDRVSIVQVVVGIATFLALSVTGGILAAGLVLPATALAGETTKVGIDLFTELPAELDQAVYLPQQSNVYARDGETLIATFYEQNRIVVPLEEISPWLQMAVVAVEDRRFWKHNGVDGEGLARALVQNTSSGTTQGASTITQQLVKNMLLQDAVANEDFEAQIAATEVSVARKLREARLALNLEKRYNDVFGRSCTSAPEVDCGKERVLEQYLNIAQFGRSVYGVEAAAQVYFGKPAAELTALEAATMAGITQNPTKWDPLRYPENTKIRRDQVLGDMLAVEYITQAQHDEYVATTVEETLDVHQPKFSCAASEDAPFFCDYVAKVIGKDPIFTTDEQSGKDLLYTGGLRIVTTLDITKQKIANEELRRAVNPADPSGFANALVALDPRTGDILVMAQNKYFNPNPSDVSETAINYGVNREFGGSRGFSPGSTFKPVILAQFLNEGHSVHEAVSGRVREWAPNSWKTSCLGPTSYGRAWKPTNAGGGGTAQQSVYAATVSSLNTSYAAITNRVDLCGVRDMAEALGFERADGAEFEVVPSMVLGSQNASPLSMATVAATLANDGVRCTPRAILEVTRADGTQVPVPPQDCKQTVDPDVARGVTYALTGVMTGGSGSRFKVEGRQSAGKTGTSQENKHTWFLGYTPQLAAVAWLGHPDVDTPQRNIRLNGRRYSAIFGATISGPTWGRFMNRALAGEPKLPMPTSEPASLGSVPLIVPDLTGMTQVEAQDAINDAGLFYIADTKYHYDPDLPSGTVVAQSDPPGTVLAPGGKVTYQISTSKLPGWWTNWPAAWNPNVAPSDYWGTTWPPPEFTTNPPNGWDPDSWDPDPDPSPSPGP